MAFARVTLESVDPISDDATMPTDHELSTLKQRSPRAAAGSGYVPEQIARDYLLVFGRLLAAIDVDAVCRVVQRLREARDNDGTVYIAGNGGSAATATHLANDLGKATKQSRRTPFRVLSLTDNASWLTALANDEGYDRVFTGQLENFARRGDVLIVISASGSSPNLVNAVEFARAKGIVTIGLLGFDGGVLKDLVDELLWVESDMGLYGPVETAHVLLCDMLSTCLLDDRP
jgi:D-sedoheptulose 7-phosphate isomerase